MTMVKKYLNAVLAVCAAVLLCLVPLSFQAQASAHAATRVAALTTLTSDDDATDDGSDDPELAGGRRPYPGDPQKEAAAVATEDSRLLQVRTVASLSDSVSKRLRSPYRLLTGASYTLVLTERRVAYTLTDLLVLAPQTFVRQKDGSYLLSENIVVQAGATLKLAGPQQLTVRLASDSNGFVSIVNYGGRLEMTGTQAKPVTITSWDRDGSRPDTTTADGRAYIRSIGGQVAMAHVRLTDLGFWSGRTAGLSLTGTDRPTPGALDQLGRQLTVQEQKQQAAAKKANPTAPKADSTGGVSLDQVLPSGDLPVPDVITDSLGYSYVSASFDDVQTSGDAYGLFVAGANGVAVKDSSFADSLVDGIVLHRYVKNATIERTTVSGSGGDGVVLARASSGVVLSEVTSQNNARNGVVISGLPLASGPSATGTPTGDYGDNSISNSTVSNNGRYGIEVIGGHQISISANQLSGNNMGIVGRDGTKQLSIVGNVVDHAARQGIALRDRVTSATVSGNIVKGGEVGIYLRDAGGAISRNVVSDSSNHAITILGASAATKVEQNTISGRGPSAIDASRAVDYNADPSDNDTSGWDDTTPWLQTMKRFAQPLTLMWIALAALVLGAAVRGWRGRTGGPDGKEANKRMPYADREPLYRPSDVVEQPSVELAERQ